MPTNDRTQLDALMDQIQEMWGHLDTLFEELNATDGWDQKHGPDWTFADVPYHLAYCNSDIVARGLRLGGDYAEDEQELLGTPEALNGWNARKLAERPNNQSVSRTLSCWQASCEAIYCLILGMNDADLERPFWLPILRGWATVRDGLEFCRNHDWSEFMQLRILMGLREPMPSPAITSHYLGTMLGYLPMVLNQEAAADREFTAVFAFSDPDVDAYTVRVADGAASVTPEYAEEADLVMTQSSETWEKTFRHMQYPVEAIKSGALQVSNFDKLVDFGQLFPV